jgi:hypothetical protein
MIIMLHQQNLSVSRFTFRAIVVALFATIWPGKSRAAASSLLCFFLALGCVLAAVRWKEPIYGSGLNRWHEAIGLMIGGLLGFARFAHLVP